MDNQNLPNQTPPVVPPTPVEPPVTPVAPTFTPPQSEQSTAPTLEPIPPISVTPTPEPAVFVSTSTTTTTVEPSPTPNPTPSRTTSTTSSAPKSKMSKQTLLIILFLVGLVLIGGIGYAIGRNTPPAPSPAGDTSLTQLEGGPADFNDTPEMIMGGQTETATSSPTAAATKYTSGTFSFNYPEGWIVIDGKDNPSYFSEKGLAGFDQLIMLEKQGNYLFIGSDNSVDAEVGGIFTSDAEYQEYLQRRTPVMIGQDQFYLLKSDSAMSQLTSPDQSAGIFGIASFSEYQQNKVTNDQQQTFNGFSDYIEKNGKGYVFVKLSDVGNVMTPEPIQSELVSILSTIQW